MLWNNAFHNSGKVFEQKAVFDIAFAVFRTAGVVSETALQMPGNTPEMLWSFTENQTRPLVLSI